MIQGNKEAGIGVNDENEREKGNYVMQSQHEMQRRAYVIAWVLRTNPRRFLQCGSLVCIVSLHRSSLSPACTCIVDR